MTMRPDDPVSVVFVPPAGAGDAVMEAADAGIEVLPPSIPVLMIWRALGRFLSANC